MKFINLRYLIIGIAMLAAAGLAVAITPREKIADHGPKVDLEAMIPKQFGEWRVDDSLVPIKISPDVQAELNKIYNETLSRTYINDQGLRVMLSIAYGGNQSDSLKVHLPEGCYGGQGFAVGPKVNGDLNTPYGKITVARLVATQQNRIEPITYWITVAGQVATSAWAEKMAKLAYTLAGRVPDGILIRISSISRDTAAAYQLQQDFTYSMLSAVPKESVERLVGKKS